MQNNAGFKLGCTANDVRISGVADVAGPGGPGADGVIDEHDITFAPRCDGLASNAGADCSTNASICTDVNGNPAPDLCGDRCAFPGDTTTFSASFIFDLSAQARYDVGAYFEVTPDAAGDGALTGDCAIITLPEDKSPFTRPDGTGGFYVDLDTTCTGGRCPQPNDLCGDIDSANDPIVYNMKGAKVVADTITATCIDTDGDGRLNLPNCTSWRQSGANALCTSGLDAFPGSPSKCNCNPAFQVPIEVPAATIIVTKTASPTTVTEPGGNVTFSVSLMNQSPFATVEIDTLDDDIYGDITQVQGDISSTTCTTPQDLAAGATYDCQFIAAVNGQGDTSQTDIVTASGTDQNGNPVEGSDDATVDIIDLDPDMSLVKTANPTSVPEPGANVTFSVVVNNLSLPGDELTLTALDDDIYGDITSTAGAIVSTTCSLPDTIAFGGNYSCSFVAPVTGNAISSQTDTITATANDEEGNVLTRMDSATVDIVDVEAMCSLSKTATPAEFDETPGGIDVTFMVTIDNTSAVDQITINSLVDSIHGNLNGQGTCSTPQVVAAGGQYSCSFTANVDGMGNTGETDTVTASGVDDDLPEPNAVGCSGDATVNIRNVAPAAQLVKDATMAVTTYEVKVTNTSIAEDLELTALIDDKFGDITSVQGNVLSTTCAVPQTLTVGGGVYSCTFDGKATQSPHVNTVEGTVEDDEGGMIKPSDSAEVTFQ